MHPSFLLPIAKSNSTKFGKLSILLLYAAIYLKDYASIWVDPSFVNILLGSGLALGLVVTVMRRTIKLEMDVEIRVMVVFFLIWVLSTTFTGVFNTSSYYVAIPCAFVIAKIDIRLFIWLLISHFFVSLFIQVNEYISGEYLFIFVATDGTELNEILFGGNLDLFRAKGLFQGPLSAVAFGIWMAIIFRGNLFITTLVLMSAFLASGRLGMLVSILIVIFKFVIEDTDSKNRKLLIMSGIAFIFGWLLFTSDENKILFILSAFDSNSDQNDSRLYFWMKALDYFSSFDFIEIFFGNFGFVNKELGATENDFLRLLLDCGLIVFLVYLAAVLILVKDAMRSKDNIGIFMGCLIIVIMNIFPFIQSLSSTVIFWIYFFITFRSYRSLK